MKTNSSKSLYNTSYKKPLTLVKVMFLSWGFITVVNGFLLNELKPNLGLSQDDNIFSYLLFGSYFVMAIPAALLIKKIGFKKCFFIGLLISASSVFFMVPGVKESSITLVSLAVVIMGTGFTVLQVAGNPYLIFVGSPQTGANRISLAGGYNSFGAWIAPLIGIIISTSTNTPNMKEVFILPYTLQSTIFIGLAVLLHFSDLPHIENYNNADTNVQNDEGKSILTYKHVILGALAIFFYVGAEVGIFKLFTEDFIVGELGIVDLQNLIPWIVPFYWGGMMFGRFIGFNSLNSTSNHKTLLLCSVGGIALLAIMLFGNSAMAVFGLIGLGLAHSVMWPIIFNFGIHGMGRKTIFASSLLIMGIIGGAALPFVMDYIHNLEGKLMYTLIVPAISYLFILFYSVIGYRYKQIEKY